MAGPWAAQWPDTAKSQGQMTSYLHPENMSDALRAIGAGSRILAGGTDLYPATKDAVLEGDLLDVTGLPELRGITRTDQGLRIGACTTWADIATASLPPSLRALQQAAMVVGGVQIQNAGTIGGNLCNASPAADGVPPLLILNAQVELMSETGPRHLPLAEFLLGPRKTARLQKEIMTAILVPNSALGGQSRFLKLGARAYLVISIAMVAARITCRDGTIASAALAVGACSGTARRLAVIEAALIGQPLATAADAIRDTDVTAALSPMDDLRATAVYRSQAAHELLRRAVDQTCKALG